MKKKVVWARGRLLNPMQNIPKNKTHTYIRVDVQEKRWKQNGFEFCTEPAIIARNGMANARWIYNQGCENEIKLKVENL